MQVKIGRKNYRVFAFDVESHNDDESIEKLETSIWLYSFIDSDSKIDDPASYGYSIEEFLDRLEVETRKRYERRTRCGNLYIAVYNLSFEWSFILPVLLKRGFVWKPDIDPKQDDGLFFNSVTNVSCASVWEGKLYFGKGHGVAVFRDVAKLYPGGLRKVAKHFNLPTQKGDIDYKTNRLHGWHVTREEKEYCYKDTRILIDICERMAKDGDTLFFKSLSAASYASANMVKAGWPRSYRPMERFRERYPHLPKEEDEFIRKGTSGGITYVVPRYQFKEVGKILHIDMHQAHPTSAYLNYFPKGKGTYFKGKPPRGMISICHVKVSYSWVKLHSVIKLIGKEFGIDEELYLWTFEIPTLKKCYQGLEIEYIDGYAYEVGRLPWRKFYDENFKLREEAKAKGDNLESVRRKTLNNSSYGKLLEHGHTVELENTIADDFSITSIKHETEEDDLPEFYYEAKYTYLPIGSCIPAYTRVRLIETALLFGYENVVYFDTDSIFVVDTPSTRRALKKINLKDELGGWGIENDIVKGQFTAPKRYKIVEDQDGKKVPVIHTAGFNFYKRDKDGKLILDEHDNPITPDYEDVDVVSGKYDIQGTMKVKGGTLVVLKEREMKVQPKYADIYKSNVLQ